MPQVMWKLSETRTVLKLCERVSHMLCFVTKTTTTLLSKIQVLLLHNITQNKFLEKWSLFQNLIA